MYVSVCVRVCMYVCMYKCMYLRKQERKKKWQKKKKLHMSQWYIRFLELWVLPVRKNSKIVEVLLFGRRIRVLFLSIADFLFHLSPKPKY